MRGIGLLLMLVAGCSSSTPSRVDATVDTMVPDTSPSCAASGSCPDGPACGAGCCGPGEHCDQGTCMCGSGPACDTATTGDTCMPGGPFAPTSCGSTCCGGSTGCPI